jgi:RNase P/RNase MRP subunit POP5
MRAAAATGRQRLQKDRRRDAPDRGRAAGPLCQGAFGRTPHDGCVVFDVGEGRHRLWGTAILSHAGVGVNLLGGTRPHIGAVAVAIPRRSRARPGRRTVTTSVLALVGHKDDELARPLAATLARALGVVAVVTAGVHLPRARPSEITAILRNGRVVASAIRAAVRAARRRKRRPE